MGQYCFPSWRLSSSVTLPVGGPASCWARGRFARRWPSVWESGGWHYMAGQCGYIRLRQHLVFLHSRSNLLICMTKHLSFSFYCIVMYTVLHHKHTTRTTWTATKKTSYRIYSRISRQFLAQFRRLSCGGRLIRGSCHPARVDSQHDGYLSATLTVCVSNMAWTISRSLGLRVCVGESTSAGFWMTTHRLKLLL